MDDDHAEEPGPPCPRCTTENPIPILYGMPSYEAFLASERGDLVIGGCVVEDGLPEWKCRRCGRKYGSLRLGGE